MPSPRPLPVPRPRCRRAGRSARDAGPSRTPVARALTGLLVALALACQGDDQASAGASAEAGSEATSITGGSTSTTTAGETEGTSAGETDTDDGPPPTYCPAIDVSLVLDPEAPIYNAAGLYALAGLFDRLTLETGATVRVLVNAGTEFMFESGCLDPALPMIVWGAGGEVDPDAESALQCVLSAMTHYSSDIDGGDWMFSGLMFPILDLPPWHDPAATGLAILVGEDDDQLGGMYSRPGMTSEAYLRLIGGEDRRRVATFTYGDGDELELFALSFNERSRYVDRHDQLFHDALDAWADQALGACDDFDFVPDLPPAEGCKKIDVLFVIDGSLSMAEEQKALAGADGQPPVFADFTDALLAELTDVEDFHVGVVSTEPLVTRLHTHSLYPETPESPETACGLPEGQRWLVGPSPALAEQFECIGATRSGVDEFSALNGALALHDPENAGFLRDDSLLFVVLLTDEDTQDYVEATMTEIRELYLDAVGGDPLRLIVLAIIGDQGVFEMPRTKCNGPYGAAVPGRRITSIVNSFRDRGHTQDLCAGSMAETFEAILGDVVSACEAINPVP
ncbi:MAG: hypothetical protein R3B09_01400 [Nannocystaceae bacterium]